MQRDALYSAQTPYLTTNQSSSVEPRGEVGVRWHLDTWPVLLLLTSLTIHYIIIAIGGPCWPCKTHRLLATIGEMSDG